MSRTKSGTYTSYDGDYIYVEVAVNQWLNPEPFARALKRSLDQAYAEAVAEYDRLSALPDLQ